MATGDGCDSRLTTGRSPHETYAPRRDTRTHSAAAAGIHSATTPSDRPIITFPTHDGTPPQPDRRAPAAASRYAPARPRASHDCYIRRHPILKVELWRGVLDPSGCRAGRSPPTLLGYLNTSFHGFHVTWLHNPARSKPRDVVLLLFSVAHGLICAAYSVLGQLSNARGRGSPMAPKITCP